MANEKQLKWDKGKTMRIEAGGQVGIFRTSKVDGVILDQEYATVILDSGVVTYVGILPDETEDIDEAEQFRQWFKRL